MILAILFDLDGTLVDSEGQTDLAISSVMETHGVPGAHLPPYQTRGRSWLDISQALLSRHSLPVAPLELAAELTRAWSATIEGIEPIPGAQRAVAEAASLFRLGVVSSSPHALIDRLLERLGVAEQVSPQARVGADDVVSPKPNPEGFLLAARRLGAAPAECVVFEDSRAGLEAARAAGMASVLVSHRCAEPDSCQSLARLVIPHYRELGLEFWERLRGGIECVAGPARENR